MPDVRSVPSDYVVPLRTRVLRPYYPPGRRATYPEDDAQGTFHAAAFVGRQVHATATIYPEAPPEALRGEVPEAAYASGAAYRLRGMASSPEARGSGLGRAVLEACAAHVRSAGAVFLWCNARVGALGFYRRVGWKAVGDEFDIPEIGGHYVMWTRA